MSLDSVRVTVADYEAVHDIGQAEQLEGRVLTLLQQFGPHRCTVFDPDEGHDRERCPWRYVLALDVGYCTTSDLTVAAGILYHVGSHQSIAQRVQSSAQSRFAYRPGYLAFREVPLLADIAHSLLRLATEHGARSNEDVLLLCDGNGTLHPRLCGVACHLGLLLDRPSIGVAKSYLIGVAESIAPSSPPSMSADENHTSLASLKEQLHPHRGAQLPLFVNGHLAGHMVRTQTDVRPLFVSSGYKVAQKGACNVVLYLCTSFRQPDPIRHADHAARMELQRLSSNGVRRDRS